MCNFYHVTTQNNWQQIQHDGQLIPTIGQRSNKNGETTPCIYGFASYLEASDGVMQWLGDEFNDQIELVLLGFKLPSSWLTSVAFELQVKKPIPLTTLHMVIPNF